jgi:hypothetical protein
MSSRWNASIRMMARVFLAFCLIGGFSSVLQAAELQGVVIDWKCAKQIVQQGREKTFRSNRSCSLMKDYHRPAFGLLTDDKKVYRLEDPDNQHILELLENTPDKDNLKVVVTGPLEGDAIKVVNITML